ncbi:hypothetical protein VTG60DRAFT_1265 [Thermothelomyces hinnuleus]
MLATTQRFEGRSFVLKYIHTSFCATHGSTPTDPTCIAHTYMYGVTGCTMCDTGSNDECRRSNACDLVSPRGRMCTIQYRTSTRRTRQGQGDSRKSSCFSFRVDGFNSSVPSKGSGLGHGSAGCVRLPTADDNASLKCPTERCRQSSALHGPTVSDVVTIPYRWLSRRICLLITGDIEPCQRRRALAGGGMHEHCLKYHSSTPSTTVESRPSHPLARKCTGY